MNRRDSLLALVVMVIWGVNFLAIDIGVRDVPPLLFVAIRFVAVVFPAILFVARPAASWRILAGIGLFMSAGQFGFVYAAIAAGLPSGIAALVLQAQVVFTIAFAALALREVPNRVQAAGVAVAVGGLFVVGVGRGGSTPALAVGLCLMGAVTWGIGNVIARAAKVPGGLGVTVWSALFVPPVLLAASYVVEGPDAIVSGLGDFGWGPALATAFTAGVSSLLGYGIFNTLLARNPAHQVVPFVLVVPPIAMLATWLAWGDVPTVWEVAGGALLLGGVLVALRPRRTSPVAEPVEAPV